MLARLHRYQLPMATAPLPTRAARRRSRPLTGWLVATGVLVQLGLFMYVVAPGLAGTSDSRLYLHAAQTLRATGHLLHPEFEQFWIDKWGPVATPLLWSHAMFLRLEAELATHDADART